MTIDETGMTKPEGWVAKEYKAGNHPSFGIGISSFGIVGMRV